jgi:hypothetical protein
VANGQGAATSTGFFPAQAEPAEEVHGATMPSARARLQPADRCSRSRFDPLSARVEARRKAPLAPEDQTNHIPNVAGPSSQGEGCVRLTDPNSIL